MLYAYLDGDTIGDSLEILLVEDKIEEARVLSESIANAMIDIKLFLENNIDISIIICGGDDVLIKVDTFVNYIEILRDIINIFKTKTGHTMSCGIGEDVSKALYNLSLAKLYGKNRIQGLD